MLDKNPRKELHWTRFCFFLSSIFALMLTLCLAQASYAVVVDEPDTGPTSSEFKFDEKNENFNLTRHEPVFFLYADPLSKLQFSFKYLLIKDTPLYFAYTQLVFWDLGEDSKPIKDVNYNPELIYRWSFKYSVIQSVDFSPIAHFSNGKDGVDSRGYDKVFAQVNLQTPFFHDTLSVAARLTFKYDIEDANRDIVNYEGPLQVSATMIEFFPGIFDRGELTLRLFPGGSWGQNWGQGGQEIGLSFRPGRAKIVPSIFIQYYAGYVESLLYYTRQESLTRFGVLF